VCEELLGGENKFIWQVGGFGSKVLRVMKRCLEFSLIFSSLVFGYSLLTVVFLLAAAAVGSFLSSSQEVWFAPAVVASGALALFVFIFFFGRIRRGVAEFWAQVLGNL
jgi:hypothetical protein